MSPLCAPCQVDGRAHLSNESPFIETLSIRIPSARSNWNNSFRCSFTKERSNTTLTDSPRTANTMNEVFGDPTFASSEVDANGLIREEI